MIMESKTKTTRLTKTNSGSSSRFLHCFKPPEMDINDRSCIPVRPVRGCRDGFSHHEPVFTYVDVAEKPGVVFTGILSDDVGVSGDGGNNQDQSGVVEKKKRGGSHGGWKLLRMMRAVMFETSLVKKIRKKKHKHKQWQSDKNGNSIQQEYSENENGRTISRNSSSSRYSSAITSSSSACSSSLSSNARQRYSDGINLFRSNNSFDRKQKQDMSFHTGASKRVFWSQ